MELINQFEQWVLANPKTSATILLVVGAIVNHVWGRFRKRIAILNWWVAHMRHAASGDHASVGQIRVLVNGSEARALNFTSVTVRNATVRDFEDLEIEFELPEGSTIVAAEGHVGEDIRTLSWSDTFAADAEAAKAVWQDDTPEAATLRDKVSRWRAFTVPVMNRLSTATFSFLWENAQTVQHHINVGCAKAGLKMAYKKHPSALLLGVDQSKAALIGIFISLLVVQFLAPSQWTVYIAFVLGVCVTLVGIGAIKTWEFVIRTLS